MCELWVYKNFNLIIRLELVLIQSYMNSYRLDFLLADYSDEVAIIKWNQTQHEHFHYDNAEWEFLSISSEEFVKGDRWGDIERGFTVELHLRRHSIFYVCNLVVPVAVISMVLSYFSIQYGYSTNSLRISKYLFKDSTLL